MSWTPLLWFTEVLLAGAAVKAVVAVRQAYERREEAP